MGVCVCAFYQHSFVLLLTEILVVLVIIVSKVQKHNMKARLFS